MSELIERFRYRFELWRRERRKDLFGPPGTHLSDLDDYAPPVSPKLQALRKSESIPRFLIRSVGLYFCIIILLAQFGRLIDHFFPFARFAVFVVFIVLVSVWTFIAVVCTIAEYKTRKRLRAGDTKSSNQSLQLTAGHRDDHPSIHETAFTPKMPRFRQR